MAERQAPGEKDPKERDDVEAAPVDGPSAGSEGEEDKGKLGTTSQDEPGSSKTS